MNCEQRHLRKKKEIFSAGGRKLAALGFKLPLFPLTLTSSLPKPPELKELRYKVAKGVQSAEELERKEKLATGLWIREQERYGYDILVDGEMDRSDFISYFAEKITGFTAGGLVRAFGNRYYKRPVITGKLEWREPIILNTWHFAQRFTNKVVKAVLTGPYTLMDWSFNEYYPTREAICKDLTKILRKEIEGLIETGAKIIQIDEPALSSRPHEFNLVADSIKELTRGFKAYFILHHRHGDLAPVWSKLIRLPVQNIAFEITNPSLSALPLVRKEPTEKDLTVGIIEAHNHVVESPRQISDRIRETLKVIPPHQIWFSSDSGLRTRTTEEAVQKLANLARTVQKFRT